MNARQKAKHYKKKYQELLNEPVKVVEKVKTPEHLHFKRIMRLNHEAPDIFDHALNIFMSEMTMELRKYLTDNNISIIHSKSAGLDVFEADLYLSFDKEGLLGIPISEYGGN